MAARPGPTLCWAFDLLWVGLHSWAISTICCSCSVVTSPDGVTLSLLSSSKHTIPYFKSASSYNWAKFVGSKKKHIIPVYIYICLCIQNQLLNILEIAHTQNVTSRRFVSSRGSWYTLCASSELETNTLRMFTSSNYDR